MMMHNFFGLGYPANDIFFWSVVALLCFLVLRMASGPSRRVTKIRTESSLSALRDCYARGEIGQDDFERRKRDLAQ
jgi:uncharacterized membrane protein